MPQTATVKQVRTVAQIIRALILGFAYTVANYKMMCVISALNACLGAAWEEAVPTFCSVDNSAHPIVIARSIAALPAAVKVFALTILFAKETKMMETHVQLTRSVCHLFAIRRVFVQAVKYMRLKLNGRCLS